jgi:hypothetical protein
MASDGPQTGENQGQAVAAIEPIGNMALGASCPLIEAIGGDQAATAGETLSENRFVGHGLRPGIDMKCFEVRGPVGDHAPSHGLKAGASLAKADCIDGVGWGHVPTRGKGLFRYLIYLEESPVILGNSGLAEPAAHAG